MVKKDLENIRADILNLRSMLRQLEWYQSIKYSVKSSTDFHAVRATGGKIYKDNIVEDIDELQYCISIRILKLLEKVNKAQIEIQKIGGIEACILERRYIEGMEWEEIGDELNYSISQVYKYHKNALKMIVKESK